MTVFAAPDPRREAAYASDLARAFGGALIFGLPLVMTQEMWELGLHMNPARLALFLAAGLPLLFGLSYYAGFRASTGFREDAMDMLAALAVGFITGGLMLALFGLIDRGVALADTVGQVALQAVPCAFGAMVARKQFGAAPGEGDDVRSPSYGGELFLMAAGAVFVGFNIAPTEEVVLIAWRIGPWAVLALAAASIVVLHLMVYRIGFAGQEEHDRPLMAFLHFTVPGYAIALMVSLYVLWTFGRLDGLDAAGMAAAVIVLGFPAAIGAAAARLLV